MPEIGRGNLNGDKNVENIDSSGVATFDDLTITERGSYFIELSFKSTPNAYSFKVRHQFYFIIIILIPIMKLLFLGLGNSVC